MDMKTEAILKLNDLRIMQMAYADSKLGIDLNSLFELDSNGVPLYFSLYLTVEESK